MLARHATVVGTSSHTVDTLRSPPDGGARFYDHIQEDENAAYRERFDEWRENIAGDMGGEWGG